MLNYKIDQPFRKHKGSGFKFQATTVNLPLTSSTVHYMYLQTLFQVETLNKRMYGKAQQLSATCYCEVERQVAMS